MIFSKTSEYAIRALSFMARDGNGSSVGVREVSEKTKVPAAYVAKIFQGLTKARILVSQRGTKGGYGFRKDPSSVTVFDILKATDSMEGSPLTGCIMGLKKCSDKNPCSLHPIWAKSREQILKSMESTSIVNAFSSAAGGSFLGVRTGVLSKRIRAILRP